MLFIIIIAITIILAILFLGHWVLYWFLLAVFPEVNGHLLALRIVLGILWVSFLIASLVAEKFNNATSRILYKLASIWLGFFLYLIIAAGIYAIALILFPGTPAQIMSLLGACLMLAAIIIGIYGIYHANRVQTTRITVSLKNIPPSWKSRKAIFLSDVHLGQIRGTKFAERIICKIQAMKPDIVLIGGDLYDGVKVDAAKIIDPFHKLRVPLGTYFITGNHEEFSDNAKYLSAIKDVGITTLMDEKVIIDGIQLIGVDYAHTTKKPAYDAILQKLAIDSNIPSILLKHVPSNLQIAEQHGISLHLSGHTHRAQVFPFTFLTKWIFKGFDYGLHPLNAMQVYTSSGIGTWGPPFRVCTKSEIVEITFQ